MVNSVKNYNEQPLSTKAEWDSSFIKNSPYVHDLLNKIEEVVSCNADPIGVTIALTGALGSGKSSIVKQTLSSLKAEYSYFELSENNSEENLGNDSAQKLVDAEVTDSSSHNKGSLAARKIELKVSEFRCLWFHNDETLMLGFVEHLSAQISSIEKDAGKKFLKIASSILRLGGIGVQTYLALNGTSLPSSVVDEVIKLVEKSADKQKNPHESSESIEELLSSLHKELEQKDAKESKKRILIVLDDLDRLDSTEVLAMFRLIKTFGNLPNIMFLLVYDNDIVSAIVDKHFPESKGKYLDKFIQLRVNMLPARKQSIVDQLKDSILKSCDIKECPYMADKLLNAGYFCSEQFKNDLRNNEFNKHLLSGNNPDESDSFADQKVENFNIDSLIAYNLSNLREVCLIKNAVAISWEHFKHQISLSDILAIEIFKQYNSELLCEIYSNIDLYNFHDGIYSINYEYFDDFDNGLYGCRKYDNIIPFICDWEYQITPISQSLSNPSLLSLYFFGGDYIESILKSSLPDFFSRLAEVNYELISVKLDELLKALINNMIITEVNSTNITSLPSSSEKRLFRYLDFVFTYFMIGRVAPGIANKLINQFYLTIASKHFNELVGIAVNKEKEQNFFISVANIISKWFARSIIDNEYYSTNRFFHNSSLLEQLASIKEKNIAFFHYLTNFYRKLANIRNSWHLDNAIKCYTIFYDLLLKQIVSGELFNLKNACSLLVNEQDFIRQIQNTDSELYEPLKQKFIKIKIALSEKFSNKQIGDPFVLELISELKPGHIFYVDLTPSNTSTIIPYGQAQRNMGRGFKEKFINLYDIKINDVFELVSDFANKLNNDPNALKSVKKQAQNALEVIDLAKTNKIYEKYIEAK